MLEICVDSIESAVTAEENGAERLELCSDLVIGGTTPNVGLLERVLDCCSKPVRVMIRPRFGDFLYSEEELEQMKRDIFTAKRLGASGVVLGLLNADGTIDVDRTKYFIKMARPMEVTFHRAFDLSRDLSESLQILISLGVDTILTSGGKNRAVDALDTLKILKQQAAGRIEILCGAGIGPSNVDLFLSAGLDHLHLSAKKVVQSGMEYRKKGVSMGSSEMSEYERWMVDGETVRKMSERMREYRETGF